jgi:hypothetical protein
MSKSPDDVPQAAGRRGWLIPAMLIGLYVLARIVILIKSKPFVAYDTSSYAPTSPVEVFSFTGHAPRPWGVPLLFTIMPSNEARAAADWFFGTVAWACLARALWITLRSRVVRIIGVLAVLGLALTPQVVVWDFAILSESLSISLGVLALGLLMIWAKTRSTAALVGMTVTAFWWIFTRQDVLTMAALLILALGLYIWRNKSLRKAAVAAALVLILGIGWHAAILPTIDKSYSGWWLNGYDLTDATFLYRLRLVVLKDPQMRSAYWNEFSMPHCAPAEQVAKGTAWHVSLFSASIRECPELLAWMDQNASSVAYKYALSHPGHFAVATVKVAPEALAGPLRGQYQTKVQKAMPWTASRVLWPDKSFVLPLAGIIAAVALLVGAAFRLLRRRTWLYLAGTALIAVSLTNIVATFLFTAGEYARFGIQEAAGLRIGLILLVLATLDGLIMRRQESAGAASQAVDDAGSDALPVPDSTG